MERYIVKQEDLVGQIEGFPIEVVQRMVDYQVEQGNKANVKIFQEDCRTTDDCGGFWWDKTPEDFDFWEAVIGGKNFDRFFEKYPKENKKVTDSNKANDVPEKEIIKTEETIIEKVPVQETAKSRQEEQCEEFQAIIERMYDTYKRKNADYGNSFEESCKEEDGLTTARVKLRDKWSRFQNLSKTNDIKVKDESLKDTLLDMANYAIMTIMYINSLEKKD